MQVPFSLLDQRLRNGSLARLKELVWSACAFAFSARAAFHGNPPEKLNYAAPMLDAMRRRIAAATSASGGGAGLRAVAARSGCGGDRHGYAETLEEILATIAVPLPAGLGAYALDDTRVLTPSLW